MSTKLSELVQRKMEQEHLSLRAAGAQADISHTTIDRIIKDDTVDLGTLEKVCDWLGVPVTTVLDAGKYSNDVIEQIANAIALCPELADVFGEIADRVVAGEIDPSILVEVASFASYRLGIHKQEVKQYEKSSKKVYAEN